MKRTLKRELKVPEIAEKEPMGVSVVSVPLCGSDESGFLVYAIEAPSFVDVGMLSCVRETLTKWLSSTRLETRTKESNMCASARGVIPQRVMKVKMSFCSLR